MKKKGKWLLDAAIGLALSLVVVASYLISAPFLEGVEMMTFDMNSRLRQTLDPANEIVLIAIDDESLGQYGRWPWPRWRISKMIDRLSEADPKVIGLNILFSEPESNEGIAEIERLREKYEKLVASRKIIERRTKFSPEFSSATVRLDSDSKLLESLKRSGNVVLPMFFSLGGIRGARPDELPIEISSSAMTYEMVQYQDEGAIPDGAKATYPLVAFAGASKATGHVNLYPDFDGVVRREVPVIRYGDSYYPSYAIQLVMAYLGMAPTEAVFTSGEKIQIGSLRIPLDERNRMMISFNGPDHSFQYHSFHDVMKMDARQVADNFKGKIVIIGPTAVGVATLYVTPVAHNFPSVEVVANVIENILHDKFLARPQWAQTVELSLLGFIAFFIMFVLPRLKALWGAVVSLMFMTAMLGAGTYLFIQGDWIKVTYPSVLMAVGYLVILTKSYLTVEKGKELVEASQIETNKMLGLTFQGQGLLDNAFDKFKTCPLDEDMLDKFYNLSLDFERKRQYNKAVTVLEHIATKDPKFKDIEKKLTILKQASEGAVFGGVGGGKKEGTILIAEGGTAKPTLGRYEIEKELGRGAMGIVYLGRDPKINRKVAIKTMSLEDGSGDAETKEIKERFFREAESAGTLNHPNIVRIFDAGEEQDVAFIAMELLDGEELTKFAKKDGLLEPVKAMDYIATVADALDYAHESGIVHRDIKPANIMLLKDGSLRVCDFGIARITASSKTATGTVMGTPSYMSPEQVQGKKVDGRADIFSLTVVLFEFLTGEKPFKGGDGIGTLLFQIANDPHPDPRSVRDGLPRCVSAIVDKGMAKDPDERYARGKEMAAALRSCIAAVKDGTDEENVTLDPANKIEPVADTAVAPAEKEPEPEPAAIEPPKPDKAPEPAAIELPKPDKAPEPAAIELPTPDKASEPAEIELPEPDASKSEESTSVSPPPAEKPAAPVTIDLNPKEADVPAVEKPQPPEPTAIEPPKAEPSPVIEMPTRAGVFSATPPEETIKAPEPTAIEPPKAEPSPAIEMPTRAGVFSAAPPEETTKAPEPTAVEPPKPDEPAGSPASEKSVAWPVGAPDSSVTPPASSDPSPAVEESAVPDKTPSDDKTFILPPREPVAEAPSPDVSAEAPEAPAAIEPAPVVPAEPDDSAKAAPGALAPLPEIGAPAPKNDPDSGGS